MATITKCATCARFPGLLCGPCAAKRDALASVPSKTDMQVCALREYVLAHAALSRARNELMQSLDLDECANWTHTRRIESVNSALDVIMENTNDPRDIDSKCALHLAAIAADDTDADPEDQEIEGDTDGHERCTSCDDALAQSQTGLCDDCQNAEDDENEEWSAGWNMPGYMPDNPPEIFATQDDAKRYIIDELKRSEDDAENEDDAETLCHFAEECNLQSGEFCATCGKYHYFVSKV